MKPNGPNNSENDASRKAAPIDENFDHLAPLGRQATLRESHTSFDIITMQTMLQTGETRVFQGCKCSTCMTKN